jgi:hypothetical protein
MSVCVNRNDWSGMLRFLTDYFHPSISYIYDTIHQVHHQIYRRNPLPSDADGYDIQRYRTLYMPRLVEHFVNQGHGVGRVVSELKLPNPLHQATLDRTIQPLTSGELDHLYLAFEIKRITEVWQVCANSWPMWVQMFLDSQILRSWLETEFNPTPEYHAHVAHLAQFQLPSIPNSAGVIYHYHQPPLDRNDRIRQLIHLSFSDLVLFRFERDRPAPPPPPAPTPTLNEDTPLDEGTTRNEEQVPAPTLFNKRCPAKAKSTGRRCRRPTQFGANYCRSHGGAKLWGSQTR